MVYNDGTDDEPVEFHVWTPDGRVIHSNTKDAEEIRRRYHNLVFGQRYNVVGSDISDELGDLLKYYDYDCDQSDVSVEEEKVDINAIDAKIAFAALILCCISGLIGVATDSVVWLLIAIASFVIMLIFAWLYNREER